MIGGGGGPTGTTKRQERGGGRGRRRVMERDEGGRGTKRERESGGGGGASEERDKWSVIKRSLYFSVQQFWSRVTVPDREETAGGSDADLNRKLLLEELLKQKQKCVNSLWSY